MIIGVRDVDAMRRIQTDLEEISQAAVRAAGEAAGGDIASMVDMIGRLAQRELRGDSMAIHALRHEHVPVGGQGEGIGIAGLVGPVPRDGDMPVGIGGDPGEEVRLAGLRGSLRHLDGRRPALALVGREGIVDVGVIRPSRVDVAELVHGQRREQIAES